MVGNKNSGRKKGYKRPQEVKDKIRESCRNCPVVHHINGNHEDNRPENRMILTPREHAIVHRLQGDLYIFKKGNNLGKHWKWKKNNKLNQEEVKNG